MCKAFIRKLMEVAVTKEIWADKLIGEVNISTHSSIESLILTMKKRDATIKKTQS